MAETKQFHIGDILTILTGTLVSPNRIGGVYEICDWMTGQQNFTHQLPRVSREIEPQLRADFPDLAGVTTPDSFDGEESVLAWIAEMVTKHGETRDVERLRDPADHTAIDPIAEIRMINPAAKIIEI